MIPYDELVVALQTWRARQGLPVAQLSGALTPPPVVAPPPPAVPTRKADKGSGSGRAAAPPAPPGRPPARPVAPPPPIADETIDEASLSMLDGALDEHGGPHINDAHYENDGDNFSIPFDAAAAEVDESTSIGAPPVRPSDMDATNPHGDPTLPRTRTTKDDW